jgi:hypothetical protein
MHFELQVIGYGFISTVAEITGLVDEATRFGFLATQVMDIKVVSAITPRKKLGVCQHYGGVHQIVVFYSKRIDSFSSKV